MVKKKRKKTRSLTRKRQNNDNGPENILSTKKTIKKQESFRLREISINFTNKSFYHLSIRPIRPY